MRWKGQFVVVVGLTNREGEINIRTSTRLLYRSGGRQSSCRSGEKKKSALIKTGDLDDTRRKD